MTLKDFFLTLLHNITKKNSSFIIEVADEQIQDILAILEEYEAIEYNLKRIPGSSDLEQSKDSHATIFFNYDATGKSVIKNVVETPGPETLTAEEIFQEHLAHKHPWERLVDKINLFTTEKGIIMTEFECIHHKVGGHMIGIVYFNSFKVRIWPS